MLNFDQPKPLRGEADSQEDNRLLNKQQVSDEKYSSVLKERLSFGTFQAGCIGLY